jgi:hypothetical protein
MALNKHTRLMHALVKAIADRATPPAGFILAGGQDVYGARAADVPMLRMFPVRTFAVLHDRNDCVQLFRPSSPLRFLDGSSWRAIDGESQDLNQTDRCNMSKFGTQGMSISFCYRTTSGARVNAEWRARQTLREARRYIPNLLTRVLALQAQGLTEFQILAELKSLVAEQRYRRRVREPERLSSSMQI